MTISIRISSVLVLTTLLHTMLLAQSPTFEWATTNASSTSHAVVADDLGNTYYTGSFGFTVDFDPGPGTYNLTSQGSGDVYVLKLNSQGDLVWVKSVGGTTGEMGYSIALDPWNNVIVTGKFSGTVDFDPGVATYNLTSNGGNDAFVLKLNDVGDFQWATAIGGTGTDVGFGVCTDDQGGVITVGEFAYTIDIDPGPGVQSVTSNGAQDVFIQKLDSSGNLVWARTLGGVDSDMGRTIAIDGQGNLLIGGTYLYGPTDFDPGAGVHSLSAVGGYDVFVLKLNSAGNFVWAKSMGGAGTDDLFSITADQSGNVISTGTFTGSADFDPSGAVWTLPSNGTGQIFIQKLDSAGNLLWANSVGGSVGEEGQYIVSDVDNNLYVTGYFKGTADFDPGTGTHPVTATGSADIFLLKLDDLGNLIWVETYGGPLFDYGYSVAVDPFGGIYTTGTFEASVDFDPGPGTDNHSSTSGSDVFIQKLHQCIPVQGIDQVSSCPPYLWIDGNTYVTDNNTATYTLVGGSINGCDSVVTLDLSILHPNTSVTVSSTTITATSVGVNYQWLNCESSFSLILGATSQSYTATTNGSYAVQIDSSGCIDTSACQVINSIGLKEESGLQEYEAFPNPSSGNVRIHPAPSGDFELRAYDAQGRSISIEAIRTQNHIVVVTAALTPGTYVLEISEEHLMSRIRLVIHQ